ncbi:hypothetical protein WDU94_007993 [Cyamophila willieti]
MAVLTNMNLTSQSQVHLARSLERILEEAHLSGELNLSGRKLKDFPNSGGKYDLSDSVVVGELFFPGHFVCIWTINFNVKMGLYKY